MSNSTPLMPPEPYDSSERSLNNSIAKDRSFSPNIREKGAASTYAQSNQSFRQTARSYWLTEWFSWLFALGAIGGIVAVLVTFDGQPVPDWPYGITLGALVSLLATLATVALSSPISAGLGQAKWAWFSNKERSMADFDLIDDASRTPAMSAVLLARGKGGTLGILGALLAIVVLAVNPFAQQVITYKLRPVLVNTTTSLPISSRYQSSIQYLDDNAPVDLPMRAAFHRGLLDTAANVSTFAVTPNCPTGNCTWPAYQSLAVCARCTDLSSQIKTATWENNDKDEFLNITLPTEPSELTLSNFKVNNDRTMIHMSLNNTADYMNTNSTGGMAFVKSMSYKQYSEPLLDVFTLIQPYNDSNVYKGPFASECILQVCLRTYTASSNISHFVETPTEDEPLYMDVPQYWGTDGFIGITDAHGKNWSMQAATYSAIEEYLSDAFSQELNMYPTGQEAWADDYTQSVFWWTNGTETHLPTPLFENIAASMAQNIRSLSNLSAPGQASSMENIVSVDWYWMIFPFAILGLVGLYLVLAVIVTRHKKLMPWKTSSLAVLMHGLVDDSNREHVHRSMTWNEMEGVAGGLKMRTQFMRGGKGSLTYAG